MWSQKNDSASNSQRTPQKTTKLAATVSPSDDMSLDSTSTNTADNTTVMTPLSYVTFLSFQVGITKSNKGSEEMRTKIMVLFKILRQADNSFVFSHYKQDTIIDSDTYLFETDASTVISDRTEVSTSITMMGFFSMAPVLTIKRTQSGLMSRFFTTKSLSA